MKNLVRNGGGIPVPPDLQPSKNGMAGYRLGLEWLKWLSQILKQRARQLEIRGFKSFREAVVDESQRMAGLIALVIFAEHAGQGHRRPQLPGERRLRAGDSERFGQAVHGWVAVMSGHEDLRFNPRHLQVFGDH